ncbi:MAG: alpha/beta hydrolase-fold protein [Clostridiales bacterium]|nr:alpha/beta hydrolase-fold protein [Clostridiales bacterium]
MLIQEVTVIPELSGDEERRVFIWIPEAFQENQEERYPVLYMFDGHNVFLDETATYGKSWGMMEYLMYTDLPLIVVAPECNHHGNRRLEEYSPYDMRMKGEGLIRGQGEITMRWMAETLKPYIDANYPTMPERENTYIAGSSMGGLMSLYAVSCWNHVFSRAAALSPSVKFCTGKLLDLMRPCELGPGTQVYMDMGTEEMGDWNRTMRSMEKVNRMLWEKGAAVCMRMVPGGTHTEASWEKQIPVFLSCLQIPTREELFGMSNGSDFGPEEEQECLDK